MTTDETTNIKVSVILPVYNVEPYIGRCIKSLQTQTMHELEFIFVDDCSTDNSIAAVEAWAEQDSRVRILRNTENLGAGLSRNRGIDVARGEYLSFVDPDDFVAPDFYELLYAAATKDGRHNIAKGLRVEVDHQSGTESRTHGTRLNAHLQGNTALYRRFCGDHFTAIYAKSLFDCPSVCYGISRKSEDTTFQLRVCLKTKDIVIEPRAEYFYVMHDGSAITNQNYERFEHELDGLREKVDTLNKTGIDDQACIYLAGRLSFHFNNYRAAARYDSDFHQRYASFLMNLSKPLIFCPTKTVS